MKPQVDITRGASFVQYKITGTQDAVLRSITCIFAEYEPLGYGTKVTSIEKDADGNYTAQVWRALSCD